MRNIEKLYAMKMIKDYEEKFGVPKWYRGLSDRQCTAVKSIINALRDDIEQGTTHRVARSIKDLGLHPSVPKTFLKSVLQISRGSDLAFLYFLLETFYKFPRDNKNEKITYYSDNEQIIMSSLYHLDLIATLRELERILPPGHPSKAVLKMREKIAKNKAKAEKLKERYVNYMKNSKICLKSPYFQRQSIPQEYGKSLNVTRPSFEVNFRKHTEYKDPNFKMPNAGTFWFENYQIQPDKIAAKTILDECQVNAFGNHTHKLECLTTHKCEEYIMVAEIQDILQCRYKIIADDICIRTFKYGSAQWREKFDSLIWILLQDIQEYIKIYIITRVRRNNASIQVINPNGTSIYFVTAQEVKQYLHVYRNLYLKKKKRYCPEELEADFSDIDFSAEPLIITLKRDIDCQIIIDAPKKKIKSCLKNVAIDCTDCITKRKRNTCHIEGRVMNLNHHMNGRGDESEQSNFSKISLKSDEIYFRAPTAHQPYIFDYRKIFKYSRSKYDDFKRIRKMFVTALNHHVQKPYIFNDELGYQPNLYDAVENCVLNNFVKSAQESNKEKKNTHPISPLFNAEFFDCDDNDLMNNMLKDAFNYIKKNPRYVLVSLPDAHRLSIFVEFIKFRYGKKYTKNELKLILNESYRIYECMIRVYFTGTESRPKVTGFPPNKFIEYKYKDCLVYTFKRMMDAVHSQLVYKWLDRQRLFWFAARPFYASYKTIKNSFFSYTPCKNSDIRFFRIWKNCEYRDMAPYSFRRQIQNSKNSNFLK